MTSNDSRHLIIEAIVRGNHIFHETASIPSAGDDPGGPEQKVFFSCFGSRVQMAETRPWMR